MPLVAQPDPEEGAWCLSGWQHIFEFIVINGYSFWSFWYHYQKHQKEINASQKHQQKQHVVQLQRPAYTQWTDKLVLVFLLISISIIGIHKWSGCKMCFLWQPCHICHTLLIIITLLPGGEGLGSTLFSTYIHMLVGPFLGMVAADRTVYIQYLELENWFFQHALLLFVPLYFMITKKFPVHANWNFFWMGYNILTLIHFFLLIPLSFVTGCNLNYMLCVPRGTPLQWFGKYYRFVNCIACLVISIALRYFVILPTVKASKIAQREERKEIKHELETQSKQASQEQQHEAQHAEVVPSNQEDEDEQEQNSSASAQSVVSPKKRKTRRAE